MNKGIISVIIYEILLLSLIKYFNYLNDDGNLLVNTILFIIGNISFILIVKRKYLKQFINHVRK